MACRTELYLPRARRPDPSASLAGPERRRSAAPSPSSRTADGRRVRSGAGQIPPSTAAAAAVPGSSSGLATLMPGGWEARERVGPAPRGSVEEEREVRWI